MRSDQDHCCVQLAEIIADDDVPFRYSSRFREWGLLVLNPDPEGDRNWRSGRVRQDIEFCPFCRSKLPSSLRLKWVDALEELGFEDAFGRADLPEEFQSDRWWKERGL